MDKLSLAQLAIATGGSHQLVVAALFDDAAAIEHHNVVGFLHGGEPVGNHHDGAALHGLLEPHLHRLFGLCRDLLGLASNPIPIKAALAMLGRDTGEVRLPLVPLEPSQADRLRGVLISYGLPIG